MQNLVNTQTVAALDINVREQVSRHLSVSPNTDPKRVIELTTQQETERQKHKLGRLLTSDGFAAALNGPARLRLL